MRTKYNIAPNLVCVAIALTAAINASTLSFGRTLYRSLKETAALARMLRDTEVQSPLIALYAKCGKLFCYAQCIRIDVAVWNAMIHGCGRRGPMHRHTR